MNTVTTHATTALRPAGGFDLSPQTFEQALTFSNYLADSDLVPKDFKGKPGNCLIAMQWGSELGLKPLQSLQNLAVINGRPALWGDAVIALVLSSPVCEYVTEDDDGHTAYCRVKRKGAPEQVRTFSIDDARAAGLSGKQGPWTQYPKRMRQMRARAFALRDVFPDVLRGLPVAEEVMDIPEEKHMGMAEEVPPPQPKQIPEWPADKWAAILPKMLQGIAQGKSVDGALAWLQAKGAVTPAQEQELRTAAAQQQMAQAPAEPAVSATPAINADKLAQDMQAATDLDTLYEQAALMDAVTDEAARLRLNEIFDAKQAELEAT